MHLARSDDEEEEERPTTRIQADDGMGSPRSAQHSTGWRHVPPTSVVRKGEAEVRKLLTG